MNLLERGETAVYLPVSLMDAEAENDLSFDDWLLLPEAIQHVASRVLMFMGIMGG